MTRTETTSLRSICIACAAVLGASSAMAFDFGANIELDNLSRQGSAVAGGDRGLSQSGRVELGVSNKTDEGLFVAAKTAFVSKKDGTLGTDDMWVQLGKGAFDVKLGRFEAANLFPLPGDVVVNNAGNVYNANVLRGRKAGDVFHAAGTLQLGSGLALELGVIDTTNNNVVGSGSKGTRTVLSYAAGPLSVAAGVESGEYSSTNRVSGYGVTGAYDFGGFKLTANVAAGRQDAATSRNQSATALAATIGAFNAGVVMAKNDITGGDNSVQTLYMSYGIPLVKNATVTPAISSSKLTDNVTATTTDETAIKVRLNYTF
ncbi:MAG: carbohydrate porin [Rhodoferax sp.]